MGRRTRRGRQAATARQKQLTPTCVDASVGVIKCMLADEQRGKKLVDDPHLSFLEPGSRACMHI
eukprot:2509958-Pleurochrysis_carterae.AAC.1